MCDYISSCITPLLSLGVAPLLTVIAVLFVAQIAYKLVRFVIVNKKYNRLAREFREKRAKDAAQFLRDFDNKVPTDIQHDIFSCNATELLKGLREGRFTSEQAVIAFAIRSIRVGIPEHYVADINFYEAVEVARQKDHERRTAKDPSSLPALHGLPISVKDHITCKNLKVTAGFAAALPMERPDFDCNYVTVLRNQGAIPFVSSNVPQGLGAMETSNNIFGACSNPWNPKRAIGGSSGGEAGLVTSRCSPLGIGSDAAGSIRIPSAFCGIYGYSPTSKRVSLKRTLNLRRVDAHYFREIGCSYGPMARCVDDLCLISKATFGKFLHLDMDTAPMPWNEELYNQQKNKKMRIGYTLDSDYCDPHPAVRNALLETVEKLRARGHTLIEIKHDFTSKFFHIGLGIMCPAGIGNSIKSLLKGERPDKYYLLQSTLYYIPQFLQKIFVKVCNLFGEKRLAKTLEAVAKINLRQFYDKVLIREWLKDDYSEMWDEYKIDGLLSPVLPFTAIKHGHSELVNAMVGTTFLYNLLGAPAGVVPIRRVRKDEQYYESKVKDTPARILRQNAEGSEGLPVAVQVAAINFQDEKCLAIMKEIEDVFQYHEIQKI